MQYFLISILHITFGENGDVKTEHRVYAMSDLGWDPGP